MAGSIFGIGLSGLAAAQAGLLTAGHNISNVNTPGYSRQEVLQSSRLPLYSGSGFVGRGVNVDSVRRVYDTFLVAQTRQAQANSSQLDTYHAQLASLDNLFGNSTSGLSPMVDQFFTSINAAAANPAAAASRQVMLSSAQGLVNRFHLLDDRLTEARNGLNQQITGTVTSVNTTAAEIASLNEKIAALSAGSGGLLPPNDLLDQRDALLTSLNQQVGAVGVPQADGSLNVFMTNGQALVVGLDAFKLAAVPDPADPQNVAVGLQTGTGVVRFSPGDLSGGALSGMLAARDGALGDAQRLLGRIAMVLAKAFNDQHSLGVDVNGAPGQTFFSAPVPKVQGTLTNTGTATISVALNNPSALVASDYMLRYNGTSYTLTRLSDNTVSSFATLPQSVDGVSIALGAGAPASGDSFLIQPTRYAARDLGLALTDPAKIALAAPIRTAAPTTNTGTGRISAGSVTSAYLGAPLAGNVALTYNSAAGTLSGFPPTQPVTVTIGTASTTYPAGSPIPYTADATISFGGIQFAISGSPVNGDTFNIAPNTGGAGDNRNAVLLGSLGTQNLVGGGSATLQGAYGQLVGQIGSATQQAGIESDAQASLLTQAQQAEQQVSGVNLDEEAANLQRYQQAYQASAKVLAMAATLFDSILALGR